MNRVLLDPAPVRFRGPILGYSDLPIVADGSHLLGEVVCALNRVRTACSQGFYLEKIRVFKAGNVFA